MPFLVLCTTPFKLLLADICKCQTPNSPPGFFQACFDATGEFTQREATLGATAVPNNGQRSRAAAYSLWVFLTCSSDPNLSLIS